MIFKTLIPIGAGAAGLMLLAGCATTSSTDCDACSMDAGKTISMSMAPCMDVLGKFTAADVPALGPAEIEVPAGRWTTNATPAPAGLPGKGMAQHPMLYLGEGYNKLFVVNNGKVIWTYSTGRGGEYDDAWMLSNGNILFSRLQYVAEVTPEKKVVWVLEDWADLGPATAVQILDDPGVPENPGESEH